MTLLQGKVAIVTGTSAALGIGRATALSLARAGASVVVTDIQTDTTVPALEALVQELRTLGAGADYRYVDVTQRDQIEDCISFVHEQFGGVDILVNNAGTTVGARPFLDVTPQDWETSFLINLRGVSDFCQAVIPAMIERDGGTIVNNASTAGLGAEAGFGAYNATKHGVIGLTKTIAAEFGPHNIRCNAVCPGLIKTDMHLAANERLAKERGIPVDVMAAERYEAIAMKRAGEPDEIAEVITFLAGPSAAFVTGTAIPISGGQPVGL